MSPTNDDTHLLAAWHVQRDAEAFRTLCERYCGLVAATSRRHGSPDAAEAVQAVFLVLARRAGSVSGASLGGWLNATAKRVVKDQHREAHRRRRHEQEAAVEQARQRAVESSDPSWEEARQHLDVALASLSTGRREAILRFYLAGRPQAEIAAELGCSVAAVKMRVHEGIEGLRTFFARKGIAVGAVAWASGLASEPALVATCVQTVLSPATAPGAAVLANGVITTMIIKTATLAAAGLVLAGSCLTAALVVGAEAAPTPVVASVPPASAEMPQARSVIITPRSYDAWQAFAELERKGGPQVVIYCGDFRRNYGPELRVPVALRFHALEGRMLVEAVAQTQALRTAWVRGGTAAVLYEGVPDADVERVRKELVSADAVVRRKAAAGAEWLRDVRIVPLLVKAAKDPDADVARQALEGLRRASWDVVVLLDETASELLTTEFDVSDPNVRRDAARALGHVGGEKAQALLEKALADQNKHVRSEAASALGRVGGEKALALLEKALTDQHAYVRGVAARALGRVGGEKARALLENALSNQDASVRGGAAVALGRVGGEKARVFLENALSNQDASVRGGAVSALDSFGEEFALAYLERALVDQDARVRQSAASALGSVGGEKALVLLKKALADQDANVRADAASALGHVGGEKAVDVLESALADRDVNVRKNAVLALGDLGGEKALAVLEKVLADQDIIVRGSAFSALGCVGGEQTLTLLEKALTNQNAMVRSVAVGALGCVGGEKALALLEKAFTDQDAYTRSRAASALGGVSGEKTLALLEKAIASQDANVRGGATSALGNIGGGKAMAWLEKAVADQDAIVRCRAASALANIGGGKAMALLRKALSDQDAEVRVRAAEALVILGEETALAVLEKALTDQDDNLRFQAAFALACIDNDKARDLLLVSLASEKNQRILTSICDTMKWTYAHNPAVLKALKDFKLPGQPQSEPPPKPKPASSVMGVSTPTARLIPTFDPAPPAGICPAQTRWLTWGSEQLGVAVVTKLVISKPSAPDQPTTAQIYSVDGKEYEVAYEAPAWRTSAGTLVVDARNVPREATNEEGVGGWSPDSFEILINGQVRAFDPKRKAYTPGVAVDQEPVHRPFLALPEKASTTGGNF